MRYIMGKKFKTERKRKAKKEEYRDQMPESTPERRRELYHRWENNDLNQIPIKHEEVHEILPKEELPRQEKKKKKEKIISDGKRGIIFVYDE